MYDIRVNVLQSRSSNINSMNAILRFLSSRSSAVQLPSLLPLLLAVTFLSAAGTQTVSADDLTGKEHGEVRTLLGEPDKIESTGTQERWRYGDSMVFFSGKGVSAVIDNGELRERRIEESVRADSPQTEIEQLQDGRGWKNDWQLTIPVDRDTVVDEIVGAVEQSERSEEPADGSFVDKLRLN